jgi:hypothetical protein
MKLLTSTTVVYILQVGTVRLIVVSMGEASELTRAAHAHVYTRVRRPAAQHV